MRIRKHAKISPLLYAVSSLKAGIVLQPHVCQLNQSPWDVIDFSPPPSQVNGSGGSAENGSSNRSIPAAQREFNSPRPPSKFAFKTEEDPAAAVMCCKTDGKSWQCWREASKDHALCGHHLLLVKSYSSNSSHHATKKSAGEAAAAPPRRARRKKAPSSDPNDFYYYSGFGPRWAKKRGEKSRNNQREKEIEIEESDNVEYEEEEDEEEKVGKKRGRKPIKARSLKSLM